MLTPKLDPSCSQLFLCEQRALFDPSTRQAPLAANSEASDGAEAVEGPVIRTGDMKLS